MGTCTCWLTSPKENHSLQSSGKMIQNAPLQIPSMHPKIYALAEKVFSNNAKTVDSVDLKNREIGDEGGRYLSAILPYLCNLVYLNLEFINISQGIWEHIFLSVEDMSSIKHINLSRNQINEKNIEIFSLAIQKNVNIEALLLDDVGVTSTGMNLLCKSLSLLSNLKILSMSNNYIGDFGLASLGSAIGLNLEFLDVSNNQFTHIAVPRFACGLASLSKLKVLKISENQIRDEGFISIVQSLSFTIEELNVKNVGLSSVGLNVFYDILPKLENLSYLYLDYNKISQKSSKMIIELLPNLKLKQLSLIGCEVLNHRKSVSFAESSTEVFI